MQVSVRGEVFDDSSDHAIRLATAVAWHLNELAHGLFVSENLFGHGFRQHYIVWIEQGRSTVALYQQAGKHLEERRISIELTTEFVVDLSFVFKEHAGVG